MVPAEDKSLQENLNSGTILVLSGARGDTRRYRTFHLWQQLRLAGLGGVLSHITDPELPARFRRAELVILHRVSYDPYIAGLLEALHRRGGIAVMDTDDLVFDLSQKPRDRARSAMQAQRRQCGLPRHHAAGSVDAIWRGDAPLFCSGAVAVKSVARRKAATSRRWDESTLSSVVSPKSIAALRPVRQRAATSQRRQEERPRSSRPTW